ncbi:LPP20 family lipoprotein [Sulfurimonas sp.]
MKRILQVGGLVAVMALTFTGCAYKTECGVDGCGRTYVDRTYRTYPTKCSDTCNTKTFTIENKCTPCVTPVKPVAQKPVVAIKPKVIVKPLPVLPKNTPILKCNKPLKINVVGQGVAPVNTTSPAQAYALAKRAAIADAYRLIAEKVKGVYVEGDDIIKNMMVKRSTVRTSVAACIRNANIVETTFKEGLCEVEIEITLFHSQFAH